MTGDETGPRLPLTPTWHPTPSDPARGASSSRASSRPRPPMWPSRRPRRRASMISDPIGPAPPDWRVRLRRTARTGWTAVSAAPGALRPLVRTVARRSEPMIARARQASIRVSARLVTTLRSRARDRRMVAAAVAALPSGHGRLRRRGRVARRGPGNAGRGHGRRDAAASRTVAAAGATAARCVESPDRVRGRHACVDGAGRGEADEAASARHPQASVTRPQARHGAGQTFRAGQAPGRPGRAASILALAATASR